MSIAPDEISTAQEIGVGTVITLVLGLFVFLGMWGCPKYNVYSAEMDGRSLLAHAQFSKEVAVAEAKAKMESAEMLGQAEVLRAKGVAEANRIIGSSLKDNEAYLRYLWIQNLEQQSKGGSQVIYVPTEAGLPILEAGRATK